MNKNEFLSELRRRLYCMPDEDIEKSVEYYSEMIDDRIEDGLSETDAVNAVGNLDEIVSQIIKETPFPRLVKEKIKPKRRMKAWEIIFLIIGFPLWGSLLAALLCCILAVFAVLWVAVICLFAAFVVFCTLAAVGAATAVGSFIAGNMEISVFYFGAALVSAGLAILMFAASFYSAKGVAFINKKLALGIKFCFVGRRTSK